MCLIIIGWQTNPDYPLIVAANRDEVFARPTAPLAWWNDATDVLAGRDLQNGGTWLGITRTGRFAALTNYRDPARMRADAPSRGHLVADFLRGQETPKDYLHRIQQAAQACNGFNLLVADTHELWWHSNVSGEVHSLNPGTYGISNHLLDTPWPKLRDAKNGFMQANAEPERLLTLLRDDTRHPDAMLPSTGVSLERERELSSIFIATPVYGTRSSAVLRRDTNGQIDFVEQTWTEGGGTGQRININVRPGMK